MRPDAVTSRTAIGRRSSGTRTSRPPAATSARARFARPLPERRVRVRLPNTAMFGPDGALYLVDYGAVRDFGQSDPRSVFHSASESCVPSDPACRYNGPLVQIPQTG